MNIFRLSDNPTEAAQFYQDLHVKKIIVEASQILANCYTLKELENAPKTQLGTFRKHSYYNHPICKWVREDLNNFIWVYDHAKSLCQEFTYRFDNVHFCQSFIEWCNTLIPDLPLNKPTEQPQCFLKYPELMVKNNPVEGYRNYYRAHKMFFVNKKGKVINATWTRRDKPAWIKYMNVMITVGKQCNSLSELRNIETDYFPVWVIDQNDNQYRIVREYKAKAYDKIFEYLVANNIFAEDYNGREEKVADVVISLLQKTLDKG